jgi:carboxyl-terminal processing protease
MTAADYRNNRMEDAIEKLTEVSSDLNKVIAVHEQRLNQQEKQMGNLETVVERRREESEIKLKDVPYSGMLNDQVGYIKLTGFTQDAAKEVKVASKKSKFTKT